IASGDVNNDAVPDVVCANSSGSSFSVVLCDSVGNLSLPTNYPVGAFPLSVDLGDVDGDLDLDIVTSNFTGANFTLYENDGTGVFVNRNDLPSNQAGSCAVFHDRDNDGDMDMTGIDELQDLLILFTNDPSTNVNSLDNFPSDFNLFQNYPNPFNPTTTIKFSIPVEGFVSLNVFNALGEEVSTLVSESLNTGTYKYDWNAGNLPSGIYYYSLTADNFKATKKLILLK
ncbi:MAG: T9SS type A sorting domain-containing protein, partial [Ignavibacteriaceae bacterium]|nr:T9SS type A sorting domain-containing protein [Ignavibacteriaceae bacterium]